MLFFNTLHLLLGLVDFFANFLCNSYNMDFQIHMLVLHQCRYLNDFLKLSSVLRGLTVLSVTLE